METWDILSKSIPILNDVNGMKNFIKSKDHLKFECYDINNDIKGFEKMFNQGKLNCMFMHRTLTTNIFCWDNFDNWLNNNEKIILPKDLNNIDDFNNINKLNNIIV